MTAQKTLSDKHYNAPDQKTLCLSGFGRLRRLRRRRRCFILRLLLLLRLLHLLLLLLLEFLHLRFHGSDRLRNSRRVRRRRHLVLLEEAERLHRVHERLGLPGALLLELLLLGRREEELLLPLVLAHENEVPGWGARRGGVRLLLVLGLGLLREERLQVADHVVQVRQVIGVGQRLPKEAEAEDKKEA